MAVGVPIGFVSRGGKDRSNEGAGKENEDPGSGVVVEILVELGLRGGNDSENEGSGSENGCGVTVGSERDERVLEPSPTMQLKLQFIHTQEVGHSRLIARPFARAAKRREEMIALENMIAREA